MGRNPIAVGRQQSAAEIIRAVFDWSGYGADGALRSMKRYAEQARSMNAPKGLGYGDEPGNLSKGIESRTWASAGGDEAMCPAVEDVLQKNGMVLRAFIDSRAAAAKVALLLVGCYDEATLCQHPDVVAGDAADDAQGIDADVCGIDVQIRSVPSIRAANGTHTPEEAGFAVTDGSEFPVWGVANDMQGNVWGCRDWSLARARAAESLAAAAGIDYTHGRGYGGSQETFWLHGKRYQTAAEVDSGFF